MRTISLEEFKKNPYSPNNYYVVEVGMNENKRFILEEKIARFLKKEKKMLIVGTRDFLNNIDDNLKYNKNVMFHNINMTMLEYDISIEKFMCKLEIQYTFYSDYDIVIIENLSIVKGEEGVRKEWNTELDSRLEFFAKRYGTVFGFRQKMAQ